MDCEICGWIAEKKEIAYADGDMAVIIPPEPAAAGHLIIAPKEHTGTLRDIPAAKAKKLLKAATQCSTAVFELTRAHGTNIIATEGTDEHVMIHVVPRTAEDGLDFRWQPKQLAPEEMEQAAERLRDKAFYIGKKQETAMIPEAEDEKKETEEFLDEQEDYMIKHIVRIP